MSDDDLATPLSALLSLECTAFGLEASSQKSVLQAIAALAAEYCPEVAETDCLERLIAREDLGSTALGYGVALPHCRHPGIDQPTLMVVALATPIDFSAPDTEPVDIFFGLLVPDDEEERHLETLKILAKALREPLFRAQLREARDTKSLYEACINWP